MTTLGSKRANKANDGRLWSVPEMLVEALDDFRFGKNNHPKAILLLLDDTEEGGKPQFTTNYYQAGMKASQIIGLLAFMLHQINVILEKGG